MEKNGTPPVKPETKITAFFVLTHLFAALLAICAIGNAICMALGVSDSTYKAIDIMNATLKIFAPVLGILYLLWGCRKSNWLIFRLYLLLLAVNQLLVLAGGTTGTVSVVLALKVAMLSVLIFAADLGRAKSTVFSLVLIALSIVGCVSAAAQGGGVALWFWLATEIVNACTVMILVSGKYADKAARGTK